MPEGRISFRFRTDQELDLCQGNNVGVFVFVFGRFCDDDEDDFDAGKKGQKGSTGVSYTDCQ